MVGIYTVARVGLAGTVTADTRTLLGRPAIRFEDFARTIAKRSFEMLGNSLSRALNGLISLI